MKIYITGLPSGYEVEHLARLFYPMAPLTLTPPEPAEDCLWAEKTDTGLRVLVRQGEKSKTLEAPLPLPVEQGGETPEFALASLTSDLLRQWTGNRCAPGAAYPRQARRRVERRTDRPLLFAAVRLLGAKIRNGEGNC